MANSKAVLVTRNPCIDIDVEKEGCGLCIEPGDVEGWCRALEFVHKNPGQAAAMGARGRALCEQRYRIQSFGAQLAAALEGMQE